MSGVEVDLPPALLLCVFMVLSSEGTCLCIFVLMVLISHKRNYFLVTQGMSVASGAVEFGMSSAWGIKVIS